MFEEMIGQWEYLGSIPVRAQFVKVNQKSLESPKDMKNLVPGENTRSKFMLFAHRNCKCSKE